MSTSAFYFDRFPTLTTERLRLRAVTPADRDDLFAIYSDAEVVKYYDLYQVTDLNRIEKMIEGQGRIFKEKKGIRWGIALKDDDRIVGSCGLFPHAAHRAEIGYDLARAYWGQGIMPEALTRMLRFGFDEMGVHRIEAHVMPGNDASDRVLEKLGFAFEGLLRDRGYFKDRFQDLKSFSLLKHEFKPKA